MTFIYFLYFTGVNNNTVNSYIINDDAIVYSCNYTLDTYQFDISPLNNIAVLSILLIAITTVRWARS